MKNKNNIKNSCGGRGCHITILPWDKRIKHVDNKVLPTKHDIQKILPSSELYLDKKLA